MSGPSSTSPALTNIPDLAAVHDIVQAAGLGDFGDHDVSNDEAGRLLADARAWCDPASASPRLPDLPVKAR